MQSWEFFKFWFNNLDPETTGWIMECNRSWNNFTFFFLQSLICSLTLVMSRHPCEQSALATIPIHKLAKESISWSAWDIVSTKYAPTVAQSLLKRLICCLLQITPMPLFSSFLILKPDTNASQRLWGRTHNAWAFFISWMFVCFDPSYDFHCSGRIYHHGWYFYVSAWWLPWLVHPQSSWCTLGPPLQSRWRSCQVIILGWTFNKYLYAFLLLFSSQMSHKINAPCSA